MKPEAPTADQLGELSEVPERRTETSRAFRTEAGLIVVQEFDSPIHYQVGDAWKPIRNDVRPERGRNGWVGTSENGWTVSFGPADEGIEVRTDAGQLSVVPLLPSADADQARESPADADPGSSRDSADLSRVPHDRRPEVAHDIEGHRRSAGEVTGGDPVDAPERVTYRELAPGVDLRYTVLADKIKEDILLADASAGSSFGFEVTGGDLVPRSDGGLDVAGPLSGRVMVPPPTVQTASGEDHTIPSRVRYEVADGGRLLVHVDEAWLASLPVAAFPVAIDPTFSLVEPTARQVFANPSGGTPPSSPFVRTGRDSAGRVWRSGVRFNQWAGYSTSTYDVYYAHFVFSIQQSGTYVVNIYNEGSSAPGSWGAIGDTGLLVSKSINSVADWTTGIVDFTELMRTTFEGGAQAKWFGLRGTESGTTAVDIGAYMEMYLLETLPESQVTNISNGQVLSTTTPTLQAASVPSPSGYQVVYDFQITTSPSPGSGQVISSGPQTSTSWPVPQGALTEGVTYYAWVLTDYQITSWEHPLPTIPTTGRTFTVNLGLGEGGPSPTDEVGAVPGEASTPSEGAPGPSLPGSKVTVNLVDGNLSLSLGTRSMQTVSGPLALGFTYNSLAVGTSGLRGEYFNDTNANGDLDSGDALVGQRIDPTVSFDWGGFAKPVAAQDPAAALARWSGFVTFPFSGQIQVGAISSDGIRVSVGGVERLNRWSAHNPEPAPVFGGSFNVTAGTPVPITVTWRNSSGPGVARVFVREAVDLDAIYPLSSGWLSYNPLLLPGGWTLNAAAGAGRWVGLRDLGTSVSMFASDGSAHEFTALSGGGYRPPLTAPNDLLSARVEGGFVLQDGAGATYTFRADGVLESLVTAIDDRNTAALVYTYTGTPARLTSIIDPVSSRSVNLSYGGDAACSGAPAAAAGLLCHIAFWDGQDTTLTYNTAGRFIRLTNPGGIIHDFAYDSSGRLIKVRDPLANDAIAAGLWAGNDPDALTQIAYDNAGRVSSVTQPEPAAGTPRPRRTYSYNATARSGSVNVDGFSPSTGFAQRSRYDTRNRIVETTGPDGLSSTYAWDSNDRLIAITDSAGLRTTTFYDHASRPTSRYGPAPSASFQSNGLNRPGFSGGLVIGS